MTDTEIRNLKRAFQSRLVFHWRDVTKPAYRVLSMKGDIAALTGGGSLQLHESEKTDFITARIFRGKR